jgi:cyclopropane-fatty-acyl-phospholipid synthase
VSDTAQTIVRSHSGFYNRLQAGWLDRIARRGVLKLLDGLLFGHIILKDGNKIAHFGNSSEDFPLQATISIHDPRAYRAILAGGSLGAGESYMEGFWTTDNLTDLARIILRNQMVMQGLDRGWSRITTPVNRLYHRLRRNDRRGSQKNIHAHYDLGNDLYGLFLDVTWTYSSGIFETETSTLYDASVAKYDRICRKINLSAADHVLEIGTGWGGFAIHAATTYGCRVTTTTISDQQFDLARQRVAEAGVSDRVTILKRDYRDLEGAYDKLVSIEMIEAVGHQYYPAFFKTCSNLLKDDGIMAIQAITIGDHVFEQHKHSVDFIKRYIFPGSCIPSITALHQAMARSSDLRLFHLEDITPHYAETLRLWRKRFFANLANVRKLGYPETFIRMWDFYLSYCEAGFAERYIGDVQMVFTKPLCRQDPLLGNL